METLDVAVEGILGGEFGILAALIAAGSAGSVSGLIAFLGSIGAVAGLAVVSMVWNRIRAAFWGKPVEITVGGLLSGAVAIAGEIVGGVLGYHSAGFICAICAGALVGMMVEAVCFTYRLTRQA